MVTVHVPEPPLASVEVLPLPGNVYAGTRLRLEPMVTDALLVRGGVP